MTPSARDINKFIFKELRRAISIVILVAFISTSIKSPAYAQVDPIPRMPLPGVMVHLSPEFTPASLKGIVIHPENALKFDFIVYKGDKELTDAQKRVEYGKLTKYFLASLAIPDDDQWVNLSPYEKDRIIKDDFGKTEMGRDLLAQDYMLKQITASLIYPEDNLGKRFWDRVYAQAQEQYGTTNIPVNTFNKVWILPDDAEIYEKGNTAFVFKSHLKVMLEEDYLALSKHQAITRGHVPEGNVSPSTLPQPEGNAARHTKEQGIYVKATQGNNLTHSIASKIVKEIVLPELEQEVNEGKNFAALRQVFSGMILAAWYKRALKESFLSKIYANKAKVKGVDQDPKTNEQIYRQYLKAYKKGVFNFIKEDVDKYTNETIPRKYFSGGVGVDAAVLTKAIHRHFADDFGAEAETAAVIGDGNNFDRMGMVAKETGTATADLYAIGQAQIIQTQLLYALTPARVGELINDFHNLKDEYGATVSLDVFKKLGQLEDALNAVRSGLFLDNGKILENGRKQARAIDFAQTVSSQDIDKIMREIAPLIDQAGSINTQIITVVRFLNGLRTTQGPRRQSVINNIIERIDKVKKDLDSLLTALSEKSSKYPKSKDLSDSFTLAQTLDRTVKGLEKDVIEIRGKDDLIAPMMINIEGFKELPRKLLSATSNIIAQSQASRAMSAKKSEGPLIAGFLNVELDSLLHGEDSRLLGTPPAITPAEFAQHFQESISLLEKAGNFQMKEFIKGTFRDMFQTQQDDPKVRPIIAAFKDKKINLNPAMTVETDGTGVEKRNREIAGIIAKSFPTLTIKGEGKEPAKIAEEMLRRQIYDFMPRPLRWYDILNNFTDGVYSYLRITQVGEAVNGEVNFKVNFEDRPYSEIQEERVEKGLKNARPGVGLLLGNVLLAFLPALPADKRYDAKEIEKTRLMAWAIAELGVNIDRKHVTLTDTEIEEVHKEDGVYNYYNVQFRARDFFKRINTEANMEKLAAILNGLASNKAYVQSVVARMNEIQEQSNAMVVFDDNDDYKAGLQEFLEYAQLRLEAIKMNDSLYQSLSSEARNWIEANLPRIIKNSGVLKAKNTISEDSVKLWQEQMVPTILKNFRIIISELYNSKTEGDYPFKESEVGAKFDKILEDGEEGKLEKGVRYFLYGTRLDELFLAIRFSPKSPVIIDAQDVRWKTTPEIMHKLLTQYMEGLGTIRQEGSKFFIDAPAKDNFSEAMMTLKQITAIAALALAGGCVSNPANRQHIPVLREEMQISSAKYLEEANNPSSYSNRYKNLRSQAERNNYWNIKDLLMEGSPEHIITVLLNPKPDHPWTTEEIAILKEARDFYSNAPLSRWNTAPVPILSPNQLDSTKWGHSEDEIFRKTLTDALDARIRFEETRRNNGANIKEVEPGGIDFNSVNLNLKIKRDGKGVPLPFSQQDMASLSGLEGLEPVILDIRPATSLPFFSQLQASQKI